MAPRAPRGRSSASVRSGVIASPVAVSTPLVANSSTRLGALASLGPQHGLALGVVPGRELAAHQLLAARIAAGAVVEQRLRVLGGRGPRLGTGVAGSEAEGTTITPSVGSPGANRFPSSASRPVERRQRGVDPVGRAQLVGAHALGCAARPSRHACFRAPLGASPPARTTALACGKTSMRLALRAARAVGGEPGLRRLGEHLEPHLHPVEERGCPRRARALGVLNDWMLRAASSRSVRRDRPDAAQRGRGIDRDHVGPEVADQALGDVSGPERARTTCSGTRPLVQQDQIESLADPDVDAQGPHGRSALALPTVGQEVQQVAPGQHAEHLALLGDQDGRARAPARRTPTRSGGPTPPWRSVGPSPRRRRPAGRRDRGTRAPATRGRGSSPRTTSRRHPRREPPAPGRCRAPAGRRRPGEPSRGRPR